jgi:O-antigen/teichoic acid export membrane protein
MHMAAKVVFTADVVVIGIVLGARQAAIYAIPAKLFSTAFGIGTAGQRLMLPAFSEFEGAADRLRQRVYLRSGIRFGMAAMLLLALPFVLIPGHLIRAWVGVTYVSGRASLLVLGLVLLAIQPTQVLGQYLLARARQRRLAVLLVAKVLANVALSIVLARAVGIWGVAAATLATELAALALMPRVALREDDPDARDLAVAWLRPVLPAVVVAVPLFLGAIRVYTPDSLLALVPLGVIWTVAGGLAIWRFGLAEHERDALRRKLGGRAERRDDGKRAVVQPLETGDVGSP